MLDPTSNRTPVEPAGGFLSLWQVPAVAMAVLPALGSGLSGSAVAHVFRALAVIGSVGRGAVSAGLAEANQPLLLCLLLALPITLVFAVGQSVRRSGAPPPLPTCLAVLALGSIPPLLLWFLESYLLAVLSSHVAASVGEASDHLAFLLVATLLSAFAAPGASLLAILLVSIRSRKPAPGSQRHPAVVWWIAVLVLGALAIAFYARTAALHHVAMTG
jgi:hypothetical protein